MRAPFKGQVKPIGARWLRTGFEGGNSTEKNVYGGQGEENGDNQYPQFTPTSMEIGNQGEILGQTIFQNLITKAGKESATTSTTQPSIMGQLNDKDIMIIESKKGEQGMGWTQAENNMGLSKETQMLVNNEKHNSNPVYKEDSKNLYAASTHGGARLSS